MTDNIPEYDHEEQYKGYTIKRFPFMKSGGGFAGTSEIVEVQYYHYHVFAAGDSESLHEAGSPELARQHIDQLSS